MRVERPPVRVAFSRAASAFSPPPARPATATPSWRPTPAATAVPAPDAAQPPPVTAPLRVPPAVTRVPVVAGDVELAEGYRLEAIAAGFTYPTGIAFDERGRLHVVEAGFSYGPALAEGGGRVLRVEPGRGVEEVASGFRGPVTGIAFHGGAMYVAEGAFPGRILRVGADGARRVVVDGLRSGADHYTSELVFGPDGFLYFGVGVATNSGVVGIDNAIFGWLPDMPDFHDVPARDLVLRGVNFESADPFSPRLLGRALTGAFRPFGTPTESGETVEGALRANGVIYRVRPDGSGLTVHADGVRNVFGLGFDLDGRLLAVDHGYDDRGSRPIGNAPDPVWHIVQGGWYGWPDFVAGLPVTDPRFAPEVPGETPPQFLLAEHPPLAGPPVATLPHQAAAMKFDVSRNPRFGFVGELLLALFGTGAPATHGAPDPAGFRVVRLDPRTGRVRDFLVNRRPGTVGTGPERPIDCKFSPDGEELYVLDFGHVAANAFNIIPFANSGVLWRITRRR